MYNATFADIYQIEVEISDSVHFGIRDFQIEDNNFMVIVKVIVRVSADSWLSLIQQQGKGYADFIRLRGLGVNVFHFGCKESEKRFPSLYRQTSLSFDLFLLS